MLGTAHLRCLKLLRSIHGQVDTLRRWFLVAREALGRVWPRGASLMPVPVHEVREARGTARLDHMDDLLITGCPKKFADVQNALRRKFKFRTWKSTAVGKTGQIVGYCGAQISVTENEVQLSSAERIHKIETIHFRVVPKMTVRRAPTRWDCVRTSWIPAVVSNPRALHLICSVPMLQSNVTKASPRDPHEENKLLRYAKTHKEVVRPWLLGAQ